MMQIVYFSKKSEILDYLKNSSLEKIFVTPSPQKADGVRGMIPDWADSDVLTIAKFTADLLKKLAPEDFTKVKRKSELLLVFGFLKNKYLPDLSYEQFNQAYNLFSDLRSFTLNEDALRSVLEEQPEVIQQAVSLFWKLLEITDFIDEHGAYDRIAQHLRSGEHDEDLKKCYIFWGFQNLNGQQVDLLKALSIRYQVIIPFPISLKDQLKRSDWISWLIDHKVEEVVLQNKTPQAKAQWLKVNSREIAGSLKKILQDDDQIVLGVSKIQSQYINIIPSQSVNFKVSHQLVQGEINELYEEFSDLLDQNPKLSDFSQLVDSKLLEHLNNKESERFLKKIKAFQLFQEAITSIRELSDEDIDVDQFFLRVLKDVASLNQPRTSFVPVSRDELTISLKDMNSIEELDRKRRIILCIDDRFDDIQGLGQNYSLSIQKSLSSLGPLKRNELELAFKRWEFQDLLSESQVLVLMSSGLLKHSLVWKNMFTGVELVDSNILLEKESHKIQDYFANEVKGRFEGSYSASKLTTFQECPRKFYMKYMSGIIPQVMLESDFDAATLGTLAHKVIERFIKESFTIDQLESLCKDVMAQYMSKHRITLDEQILKAREILVLHRSFNGLDILKKFEEKIGEKITWTIEERIDAKLPFHLKGSVDCFGVSNSHFFLIDFKSTKGSASTSSEVRNYQSLQLWAYAHGIRSKFPDFLSKEIVMGYVTLDVQKDSNLICSSEELAKLLKEICSSSELKMDFSQSLNESLETMVNLVAKIENERVFPIQPMDASVCNFCEVKNVCPKGES